MSIRPLLPQDAAYMAKIHAASFEAAWNENSLLEHIKADIGLGVFTPYLSGFILLRLAAEQAEIITLAIDPAHRRRGLAQDLISAACDDLKSRGAAVIFLEVAEDNLAAIGLYRQAGFAPIGRRPSYYRRNNGRVAALTYKNDIL